MAEEVIKTTSCCNEAMMGGLLGAMANKRDNNDPMAMAAMMNGGMGGQWNNPFVYLVWMMFANRFFGNDWNNGQNAQNVELQNQIQSLRSQISDNQNSSLVMDAIKGNGVAIGQLAGNLNCDFNTLNNAICDVRQGIALLAGKTDSNAEKIINAANLGDLNIVQQLKDCCCTTQQNIVKMGYESQLGQKDIINTIQTQTLAMQQGHSNITTEILRNLATITAQNQQDKCDILRSGEMNTQRIVDVLNNHWQSDLQQRYNDARLELSQQRQNAELIAALKTSTTSTTT